MTDKPLSGIRVIEVGGYIAAPYGSSLLCSLGAEVVKVERPGGGDAFRRDDDDRSAYFVQYNVGKKSLAVDIKQPAGAELVRALLPRFDVFLENVRPGKLATIGLGPQDCRALNPRLVYASVSGFGNGGPLVSRPAYDTIGQSFGGLYSVLSNAGSPQLSGTCLADLIAGLVTATGVLAALVGRGSASGALVETSMLEAVSTLTIDAMTQAFDEDIDPTRQSRHPQAQNFCLRTGSEQLIAIHLSSSQKFWRQLATVIGRPELADDPRFRTYNDRVRHYAELCEIVEAEFRKRPGEEWQKLLVEADVPFAPVLRMSEVANHPQTEWLDLLERPADGPALVRAPWRFSGSRPDRGGRAPRVGQHSHEIAAEVLDDDQVRKLVADGILYAPAAA